MSAPGRNAGQVSAIKARVKQETGSVGIALADSDIAVECAAEGGTFSAAYCNDAISGDQIRVKVNFGFQMITGYMFGSNPIPISNNTIMVIAR